MKLIIGTKFYGHDSSVFIFDNKVFAISEERLTRYKHDKFFPLNAIKKYLECNGSKIDDYDEIVLAHSFTDYSKKIIFKNSYYLEQIKRKIYNAKYIKEYTVKQREFENKNSIGKILYLLSKGNNGLKFLFYRYKNHKDSIINISKNILDNLFSKKVVIKSFDHEKCHAISSFVSSKFDKALCITMDGYGDQNIYSSIYLIDNEFNIKQITENKSLYKKAAFIGDKHKYSIELSLGGIYTYFTFFLGFTPLADEGKVEALAAFGKPIKEIYNFLEDNIRVNGIKITINEDMFQKKLPLLLEKYEKEKENLATTIKRFSEEIILEYVKNVVKETGCNNICFSGGYLQMLSSIKGYLKR
jgi:carbamoyltransferase